MRGVIKALFSGLGKAEQPEQEFKEKHFPLDEITHALRPVLALLDVKQGVNPLVAALSNVNEWIMLSEYRNSDVEKFKRHINLLKADIQDALDRGANHVTVETTTLEGIAQTIAVVDEAAEKIYYGHSNKTEFYLNEETIDVIEAKDAPLVDTELANLFAPQVSSPQSLEVREKLMGFSNTMRKLLLENNVSFAPRNEDSSTGHRAHTFGG